jgi:hypothetical protein
MEAAALHRGSDQKADLAFFEQPQFERLLGDNLLQVLRLAPELLDFIGRRSPRRVAGEPASRRLPASSARPVAFEQQQKTSRGS